MAKMSRKPTRAARPQNRPAVAAVSAAPEAAPTTGEPEPDSCGNRTTATSEAAAKSWQLLPPDPMLALLFEHLMRFFTESDPARTIDSANVIFELGPDANRAAQPFLRMLRDSSEVVEFWNLIERSATDMVLQVTYATARLLSEAKKRAGKRSPIEPFTVEDAAHVQSILRPELKEASVAAVVLKPNLPRVREWLILGMKLEKEWRMVRRNAAAGKAECRGFPRKPVASCDLVRLFGIKEEVMVNGKQKPPLHKMVIYNTIKQLVEACPARLHKRDFKHSHGHKELRKLCETDSDWNAVIELAERPGAGYAIRGANKTP